MAEGVTSKEIANGKLRRLLARDESLGCTGDQTGGLRALVPKSGLEVCAEVTWSGGGDTQSEVPGPNV